MDEKTYRVVLRVAILQVSAGLSDGLHVSGYRELPALCVKAIRHNNGRVGVAVMSCDMPLDDRVLALVENCMLDMLGNGNWRFSPANCEVDSLKGKCHLCGNKKMGSGGGVACWFI